MTDAEDITRLLATREQHFSTVVARGIEWRNHDLLNVAFRQAAEARGHGVAAIGVLPGEPQAEGTQTWALWEQAPDLARAEFDLGVERVTAVFRGETWWSYSPSQGRTTNHGRSNVGHGRGPGDILLHPADVIPALSLEYVESSSLLGRLAHRVLAVPVAAQHPRQLIAVNDIGTGADQFKLVVDAILGIVLRVEALLEGERFRVLEIEELVVDQPIPSEAFAPPG